MLQKQHANPLLTRRERQMMDIVYRLGRATAAEVHASLPDPPTYSAVRAKLVVLEQKGHLRHQQDGPRYVYLPAVTSVRASKSALKNLLDTFFSGSATEAAAALLDPSVAKLSAADLDSLSQLVEKARKEIKR